MKKIVSFLLAAVMMLTLAGCNAANKPAPQPGQQGQTPQTGQKQKLVLWHIQVNKVSGPIVDAAVERFKKANPNYEVENVAIENDPFKTKLKVAMGSGTPPDIFHSWGGGWLEAFVNEGLVMDITEDLKKDNWKSMYYPAALSMTNFKGKDYGIAFDLGSSYVWYNKDLFAKNNVQVPKTWNEFLNVIKTFKSKGITPLALANQAQWPGALYYNYLVDRVGSEQAFINAYSRKGSFEDPAFIEAGKMIQQLVDAGAFNEGFNGMNYDTGASRMLMYSDKAAMQLQTTGFYSVVKAEQPDFAKNKLDFFPFPAVENGKGDPSNIVGGVNAYSIAAKTKDKEGSLKLLRFLTDQTAGQEWVNTGRVAPVNGTTISDPMAQKMADYMSKAKYLQGYYDQLLPPELGTLSKEVSQGIFGKTITPEEGAKRMEAKAKEVIK